MQTKTFPSIGFPLSAATTLLLLIGQTAGAGKDGWTQLGADGDFAAWNEPTYHHIDEGSPPAVNAAKPPGQWQTLDIIFQGDYGPTAMRNIRVRPWKARAEELNVPPEGFSALFNGKDFTGWNLSPKARQFWSIDDGVLKSHGLLREWGADLATERKYRDFVLMLDFRMPTISDSGINFRRLIPEIQGFGNQEQFNLRSKGGMGHLESYYFLPQETAQKMGLKEEEKPHVRHIDPEVGVWHTVKLTMKGRTFSAEYDGEVLYDNFEYHDWMMNMEPAPIRLQKHIVVHGDNLGKENPCPIEYRNIFIKEIQPSE